MVDTKLLKSIPLFAGLTAQELTTVSKICSLEKVSRNSQLFKKGDKRETFFVVTSGRVHLYRKFNEEHQTLAILDPYDFVVESALVNPDDKHQHFAETWQDTELLCIKGKDYTGFAKQEPAIANRIYAAVIQNIASRLHHANNKILTLYSTGRIAASYDDIYNLSELLLKTILEVIKADRAVLALFDADNNRIVIHEAIGYSNPQSIKNLKLSLVDDNILGTIYRDKTDIVVTRQEYVKNESIHTQYASATMLGVKIQAGETVIGAILLGDKEHGQNFSYNNHILLDIISRQVALALREAERKDEEANSNELNRVYIRPFQGP